MLYLDACGNQNNVKKCVQVFLRTMFNAIHAIHTELPSMSGANIAGTGPAVCTGYMHLCLYRRLHPELSINGAMLAPPGGDHIVCTEQRQASMPLTLPNHIYCGDCAGLGLYEGLGW